MPLPPGPAYLLRIIPYYAPSVVCALGFRLLQEYDENLRVVPTWVLIPVTLVARPLSSFLSLYWANFKNARAAAAHGAVLPPTVQQSIPSIINGLAESTKNGYPGKSSHPTFSFCNHSCWSIYS